MLWIHEAKLVQEQVLVLEHEFEMKVQQVKHQRKELRKKQKSQRQREVRKERTKAGVTGATEERKPETGVRD